MSWTGDGRAGADVDDADLIPHGSRDHCTASVSVAVTLTVEVGEWARPFLLHQPLRVHSNAVAMSTSHSG
jgi:hypothetical protein